MWFGILTLATALIISVSAAYYSILGLTAIFAAAFWPIVILGSSLEVGKIVSTLWLHKYWDRAELQYKIYLCSAVAILMLLTSMGVFGFLSKAHSDQGMVSGDVTAKIAIYDEKIKQARDNIDMARKSLQQMDAAVDQTLGRSSTEQGADKAAQLRRSQAAERNRLLREIDTEQKKIQALNDERAPIAAEVRKVEAEVGPIKYIAALIYGDNPETNLLEKAVRWVIILIVIVFDPLALTLLLAATKSIEWERGINIMAPAARRPEEKTEKEDEEATEFFDRARNTAQAIDNGTYQAPEEANPYQDVRADEAHWYDQVDKEPVVEESKPVEEPPVKPAVAGPRAMYLAQKMALEPDAISGDPGTVTGFGSSFPTKANKGDMYLRVDHLPNRLFKYNGSKWIELDKNLTDTYVYDDAYIDHLIEKISTGEYDTELLNEAEKERIKQRLNNSNV